MTQIVVLSEDILLGNYLRIFLGAIGHPSLCLDKFDLTLSKIKQLSPAVVMVDSRLPEHDCAELMKAIRELEKQPTLLLLNGPEDSKWRHNLGEDGKLEQIRSPFDPEEVRRKLERIITKSGAVSPALAEHDEVSSPRLLTIAPGSIVGFSKEVKQIMNIVDRVAETDVTVLIRGESGTGKELVARRIHGQSERKDKPYIKVLCPAIPDNLLESELFGYEKGSFTGAFTRKPGRFEFANHGTIFLDEIGEFPLPLQSKLLQVLQEGEFTRIGGKADIRVNVRIIAATNKDLEKAVREGSFREDLFYRLNVVNVYVPPLRERKEDIPILVRHFLDRYNNQFNKKVRLANDTLKLFMTYDWPGNVRELEHTMESLVILVNEKEVVNQLRLKIQSHEIYTVKQNQGHVRLASGGIQSAQPVIEDPQQPMTFPFVERRRQDRRDRRRNHTSILSHDPIPHLDKSASASLKSASREAVRRVEQEMIKKVLDQTYWNRKEAARILGISYKALLYKIKQLPKKIA